MEARDTRMQNAAGRDLLHLRRRHRGGAVAVDEDGVDIVIDQPITLEHQGIALEHVGLAAAMTGEGKSATGA